MKKRLFIKTATIICTAALSTMSCIKIIEPEAKTRFGRMRLDTQAMTTVRSEAPDETLIKDANIFIFDRDRNLLQKIYMDKYKPEGYEVDIRRNKKYEVFVCCNLGYEVEAEDYETVRSLRHYIAYPDDYKGGMPMAAHIVDAVANSHDELVIPIRRAMAKVSIRIDRSRLTDDVKWEVKNVKLGGCARYVSLFSANVPSDQSAFFPLGYIIDNGAINRLNASDKGMSETIDLYMMENLIDDTNKENCPYVEIKVLYESSKSYTPGDKSLTYRFHIQNPDNNYYALRNTWYRFRITPEQDGLGTPGWEFVSDNLMTKITSVIIRDKEITLTYKGENKFLAADIIPEDTSMDMVIWDSSDPNIATVDGQGTVTATGKGTCNITCTAINDHSITSSCLVHCIF